MVVHDGHEYLTEEERRLKEDRDRTKYWKKWGPYVAERQWATGMWFCCGLLEPLMIRQLLTKIQFERITVMTEMLGVVSLLFF